MSKLDTSKIEKNFNKVTSSDKVHEALLLIEDSTGEYSYSKTHKRDIDTPMLLSSITKLYTTACIYKMVQEDKLSVEDKVVDYLGSAQMKGLHTLKGTDYSGKITIRHLLFQTSGLPDFYLDGGMRSLYLKVLRGDLPYSFEEEIGWVKQMNARFAPASKNKAFYADINFDLLGKIIETVNESTLQEAFTQYIFEPLNLTNTYIPTPIDHVPHSYHKGVRFHRPMFIRSCFASGGLVSTARELMIFLKAFWKGELFHSRLLDELKGMNPLQASYYPLKYRAGYMHVVASRPFGKKSTLVGHSGSTGSFAFYAPEKDLFFVGDIPQIDSPSMPVRFVMKIALAT